MSRIECPHGPRHSAYMEWETVNGIRTGSLVAHCYTCRRNLPRQVSVLVSDQPQPLRERHQQPLALVRAFMAREGRTPTAIEMGTHGGKRSDLPWAQEVVRVFGSMRAFWSALGVDEPRKRGDRDVRRTA